MKGSIAGLVIAATCVSSTIQARDLIDAPGQGYREQIERVEPRKNPMDSPDARLNVWEPLKQLWELKQALGVEAVLSGKSLKAPEISDPEAPFVPQADPALEDRIEAFRRKLDEPVVLSSDRRPESK